MSEQTEITFMQTRLIRLASDCCSIGSPAVYRYDDCTGSGKSLRHAGTGRICGNNTGGACRPGRLACKLPGSRCGTQKILAD